MANEEVTGLDIDGTEYVNVQVGGTLFRDGGPYGDQSDAIRDEKVNAAREGREPNFDSLIPAQYKLVPKEQARKSDFANVESQRQNYNPETLFLVREEQYEKVVKNAKAKTIKLSTGDEAQADSQNISRAALTNGSTPAKTDSSENIFED